jgi:hypothetical protein
MYKLLGLEIYILLLLKHAQAIHMRSCALESSRHTVYEWRSFVLPFYLEYDEGDNFLLFLTNPRRREWCAVS